MELNENFLEIKKTFLSDKKKITDAEKKKLTQSIITKTTIINSQETN